MKKIKFFLTFILLLMLTPMSVLAKDSDGDGRLSQGYILVGGVHVDNYNVSMEHTINKFNIKSPNGKRVKQIPFNRIEEDIIKDGSSAVWCIPREENTLDFAPSLINYIIKQNSRIEEWNILICWGDNVAINCSLNVDDTIKQINSLHDFCKNTYNADVYYLSAPSLISPSWKGDYGALDRVNLYTNEFLNKTNPTGVDLRSYGQTTDNWNYWINTILYSDDRKLSNDYFYRCNGDNSSKDSYDGRNLTLSTYQYVFGNYIQELENAKGGYDRNKNRFTAYKEPYEWEELAFKPNNDNGLVQAFFWGLNKVNAPLSLIGYPEERPITNPEDLCWNIWKTYYNNFPREDRTSTPSFKLIEERWIDKTSSTRIEAGDLLFKAFMDLTNSGKIELQYASLNPNKDNSKTVFMQTEIASKTEGDKFVILEIGGYVSEFSPIGETRYCLVDRVDGNYIYFKDMKTGASEFVKYKEDGSYVVRNKMGIPRGFTNAYVFTYTPEIVEEVIPAPIVPPEEPKIEKVYNWDDLTIHNLEVDIPNFNGSVRFIWAADLHIICNENDWALSRYAIISAQQGYTWDGPKLLDEIADYAEYLGAPLILGGDVVDYASKATYAAVREALGNRTNQIHYIGADHDYLPASGPNDLGDATRSIWYNLPGAFDNGWLKKIILDGLPVYMINFSTETGGETKYFDNGGGIVFTHVPFDLFDHAVVNKCYDIRGRYYCWSDLKDSVYKLQNSSRMSNYLREIQLKGIGAVFTGHVHADQTYKFADTNDSLQTYLMMPAYRGNVYDITVK